MKYSIHRVLSMIKTTKARIEKELLDDSCEWVRVSRGQEENIRGVSIKDIKRDIQSHYDRITALIENYIKLKSALIRSNAGVRNETELHTVSVAGRSLTVAEIIEMNDTVYGRAQKTGFKSMLLKKMKQDYSKAQITFDDLQEKVNDEVDKYIKTTMEKKKYEEIEDNMKEALIDSTSKMLHEKKDPQFIDPLKIADKITNLENEIESFRSEIDAVLSEQNALTVVEINLTDIN